MNFHTFVVIFLAVCYIAFMVRAFRTGAAVPVIKAHFAFWYPVFLHKLKAYKSVYKDHDLYEIARKQLIATCSSLYFKPYAFVSILWSLIAIYWYFAPELGWPYYKQVDFVFKQFWPYALILGWSWGTVRANQWAAANLVKAPSSVILEWGELYRKDQLKDELKIKLVEKYWPMYLVKKAMASVGGKEYGFMAIPNVNGSINLDASKLPALTMFEQGRLEVDTQGFLLPYDTFVKSLMKKLESFTGFRTISFSKSGKNSIINWQVTHKPLPAGVIKYADMPVSSDPYVQNFGFTGTFWVPIRWKATKHLAIVGNTGMGKSVIMRVIMAGSQPETIILAGDLGDADAVSFVRLRHDPYQLEALEKQKLLPDQFAFRKQYLDPLPTVVISRNKAEYLRMCRWLNAQFLHRTQLCGEYHACEDVFEVYQKTGLKVPRIMLFLDEAASAFIHASESDKQTAYIKKTIFDMLVKGRKMDIVVVPATQYASMEALGKARAQMSAVCVYTKGSSVKMVFGEEVDLPAPGLDGEYTGTFVMETPDGGYVTAKAPYISQDELAKIIFNRANPKKLSFDDLMLLMKDDQSACFSGMPDNLKYTLKCWLEALEAVESTDDFIPVGKSVKIVRGHEEELVELNV